MIAPATPAADAILAWLTDPSRAREAHADEPDALDDWWRTHRAATAFWPTPVDRAIARGFRADRIGFAFAAGYQAALRALLPDLADERVVSLCITEEGGGHPRAIETTLVRDATSKSSVLEGSKRWATLSSDALELLVAARAGQHPDGRPHIVIVRVMGTAPGVSIEPMPPTPFAPEISHGAITFAGVTVHDGDVLPGDGYAHTIKPFRTLEDIHVTASFLAHLYRLARRFDWPAALAAELLGAICTFRMLATADPASPATHVGLEGALTAQGRLRSALEPHLGAAPPPFAERFARDVGLTGVAGRARAARFERAWARTVG